MLEAAAEADDKLWDVVEHISIFARMKPENKERVIRALRERGLHTLMCGDGANDVGALKQAHVGVALLSGARGLAENGRCVLSLSLCLGPRSQFAIDSGTTSCGGAWTIGGRIAGLASLVIEVMWV